MQPRFPLELFNTLPPDILCNIALELVRRSPHPLHFAIVPIRSLLLTSRHVYNCLSLGHRPDLYADIFQISFDMAPIRRRLGVKAVFSTSLAHALVERCATLKRLSSLFSQLPSLGRNAGEWRSVAITGRGLFEALQVNDLMNVWIMLMENDCRNKQQLNSIMLTNGLARILVYFILRDVQDFDPLPHDPRFSLCLVLIRMTGVLANTLDFEDTSVHGSLLDFAEPFLHQASWVWPASISDRSSEIIPISELTMEYLGNKLRFKLPSGTSYSRLWAVDTYAAIRRSSQRGPGSQTPSRNSLVYDKDWFRLVTLENFSADVSPKLINIRNICSIGSFDNLFKGFIYVPCPVGGKVDTVSQPVGCALRVYHAVSEANTVTFIDNDETALEYAWLPNGVKLEERADCLRIYDPVKKSWLQYQACHHSTCETYSEDEGGTICDTILVGETDPSSANYAQFEYHGRIRPSNGMLSLQRKPKERHDEELGIWSIHGYVYGDAEIIGDWRPLGTQQYSPGDLHT
ncbi:hypothetical protein M422DRAFT_250370 [Sphaerobolus stellatus SS14]|uniref:Uncharacterized protein n=1 Tax=Sphaerobolus stellatus (strain SS14) TaxID=990650 RepID=A0A0C9VUE5_SPHS4|nr:hypothetical protein M422DRAFT_250370 [Sphaerobolus stellatus SS14]